VVPLRLRKTRQEVASFGLSTARDPIGAMPSFPWHFVLYSTLPSSVVRTSSRLVSDVSIDHNSSVPVSMRGVHGEPSNGGVVPSAEAGDIGNRGEQVRQGAKSAVADEGTS
jgi:hypothetical protein